MRQKTFVTVFPICENVHLTKDLGQIPYFMHRMAGYDSRIVTYKNSESYPNLEGEVKGLKVDFIENTGRWSFLEKGVLRYIRRHAKEIDVLNLYHFSKYTFAYGILYKILNPRGFIFVKLDAYNEAFEGRAPMIHSTKKVKNFFLRRLERMFLRKVDLMTIENRDGERLVKAKFPEVGDRVLYMPVGVNDSYIGALFAHKMRDYSQKENLILCTGRIGEEVKNHEMILRALARIEMGNWKMVFVGPVNPRFQKFCEGFFQEHPQLKDKIIFTGNIIEREKLYEWYNRSKIVCMTSRRESFCLTIVEGLYFGNYILGTEGIMSMKDISDKGKYGKIIPDNNDEELAVALGGLIGDEQKLRELYPQIVTFSRNHFVWSRIIHKISDRFS